MPLNLLQSLEAPAVPFESAEEDLRDEIAGIVAGLLGLVGIEADPLRSREHILPRAPHRARLARGQRSLDLESLIAAVADPPFEKLGALPLESVYPRKERQALMMALNNLLASPRFEAWREGEPLDVERLLRAADGRPRLSIVYTAHLAGRRAALRDRAAARQGEDLDAPAERHVASCARSSTWTRSSATSRRIRPTRRPSGRCSRC